MTKFMINNRTDSRKTDLNLLNGELTRTLHILFTKLAVSLFPRDPDVSRREAEVNRFRAEKKEAAEKSGKPRTSSMETVRCPLKC